MTVHEEIDELKASLGRSGGTLASSKKLLENIGDLNTANANFDTIIAVKKLQRDFILDSFKVNRFHKEYKNWIHDKRQETIDKDVREYNLKLGKTARLNSEVEDLDNEFENLRNSIKLPDFKFSIQTIEKYDCGRLLELIQKDEESGDLPAEVHLSQLFSLDSDSQLPSPDFKSFKSLLNIEYRLRIQKRIKYEILLTVKNQLTSNNRKWTTRDVTLNEFITNKLAKVIQEVEDIKKSEYEDLKNFEYSEEEEDEDDDDDLELEQELEIDDEAMDDHNKNVELENASEDESVTNEESHEDDLVDELEQEKEEENSEESGVPIQGAENVDLSTTTTTKENTPIEKENDEEMLIDL